jgi:hypothetical protein
LKAPDAAVQEKLSTYWNLTVFHVTLYIYCGSFNGEAGFCGIKHAGRNTE